MMVIRPWPTSKTVKPCLCGHPKGLHSRNRRTNVATFCQRVDCPCQHYTPRGSEQAA